MLLGVILLFITCFTRPSCSCIESFNVVLIGFELIKRIEVSAQNTRSKQVKIRIAVSM